MSALDDFMRTGFDAIQPVLDDTAFVYGGHTFFGFFSNDDAGQLFESGGPREQKSAVIVATKAQFATAGVTPAKGQQLTRAGQTWKIDRIEGEDDEAVLYEFNLLGINQ